MPLSPASQRPSIKRPRSKIGLLFESTNSYARELLRGIGEFALSHTDWQIHHSEIGAREKEPDWLRQWDGAGLIVRGENRAVAKCVASFQIPVVDLTPSRLLPRVPWVKSDDRQIAAMAVDYFWERGYRSYGYCGLRGFRWSEQRGQWFFKLLERKGGRCDMFEAPEGIAGDMQADLIATWVEQLPKPVAIFTCFDSRARQVVDACQAHGISVPEEVAVLGVDNDDVICSLSPVPLSSVILNPKKVGWEAAALLAQMLSGNHPAPTEQLIPPIGIVTRQSTDVLAVGAPQIAQALRYIRENATTGIGVKHVLEACPMSRRSLEQKFRELLNKTPHDEILRVQLEHAKTLLLGTTLRVGEIAERVSLENAYFSAVFKRQTGFTPREFRIHFGTGS
ncbi:MAG: DNA-binding transcriptional regulator [Verrucomicrobiota bacterium]